MTGLFPSRFLQFIETRSPATRRGARRPRPIVASAEMGEVFVQVERIRRRAFPARGIAGDRPVARELGLEHALAAGQAGQLAAKVLDP